MQKNVEPRSNQCNAKRFFTHDNKKVAKLRRAFNVNKKKSKNLSIQYWALENVKGRKCIIYIR